MASCDSEGSSIRSVECPICAEILTDPRLDRILIFEDLRRCITDQIEISASEFYHVATAFAALNQKTDALSD